jgi:ectoine hydroxylase-related dioxygenase (phytanoyl-CoA dioxygenase family)
MPFEWNDSFFADYASQGYVVYEAILPLALVADLRRETDKGRAIIRREKGPQAQRLQPVENFDLDMGPFKEFAQLPELNDAIRRTLGRDDTWYGDTNQIGFLIEPGERPYCTGWHRDRRFESEELDAEEFRVIATRRHFINQFNGSLYQDNSTWYVPGSDLRPDLPSELEAASPPFENGRQPSEDMCPVEAERICIDYCRHMPGAVNLNLQPGDFAMYRGNGWHIGNYAPYRVRATLHGQIFTPEWKKLYHEWNDLRKNRS